MESILRQERNKKKTTKQNTCRRCRYTYIFTQLYRVQHTFIMFGSCPFSILYYRLIQLFLICYCTLTHIYTITIYKYPQCMQVCSTGARDHKNIMRHLPLYISALQYRLRPKNFSTKCSMFYTTIIKVFFFFVINETGWKMI